MLFLLFLLVSVRCFATHQRAAEITYKWIGGNTYEFTLTCYTFTPSAAGVQRDSLLLDWGDGSDTYVPRVVFQELGDDYTLNIYRSNHTFSSSGTYVISMEDPNRNYGIVNVPNSVSIPMYIESELVISPYLGYNNSVQLLNAPVDKGCVGKLYLHNPSASDPDGDSLSFRIVNCKGVNGEDIPGYSLPQTSGIFEMDSLTGELRWDAPVLQGEYNVAFVVEEWRNGVRIGYVTRDMQILIAACDNDLPEIQCVGDTCVVAGSQLAFYVTASDPDGDEVTLTASGAPFELSSSPAMLIPETSYGLHPEFEFIWNTACQHVRKSPYQVVFRAKDNSSPVNLTNVKSISISVLGPPIEGISAVPDGSSMMLEWDSYACQNVKHLCVYRKVGSESYEPDFCETGIRDGFDMIAELDASATSYLDDNGFMGLEQGLQYCYRIVAVFHDGAESIVSEEACAFLLNDDPLMTHVSNDSLNMASGNAIVAWSAPKDLDTTSFQHPFSYLLARRLNGVESTVFSGAISDTSFVDTGANMNQAQTLSYQVKMVDANQTVMGLSTEAFAIRLSTAVGDASVTLRCTEEVPWIIDSMEVFRALDGDYLSVGSTTEMKFTDTDVVNDKEYHYYVRTFGHYMIDGVAKPLVNYSPLVSATPTDNEPPAHLSIEVIPDCDAVENLIIWHGGDDDDIASYNIYYTPSATAGFTLLNLSPQATDTAALHSGMATVVGCYYMTATDVHGNVSQPSDTVCIDYDYCPLYVLPNVFTPNSDGVNDFFVPISVSQSSIDHISMTIFNRWGRVVYVTDDLGINWDGKDYRSKQDCSDGTYFYVCEVYYDSYDGISMQTLKGSIAIVR